MQSMKSARLDFKKIRDEAQVEPVINHYGLRLVRKGDELQGLCPFHEDSKPSFGINVVKKIWRCFGCDAKGNLIELVVRLGADGRRGVSIKEAYRLVAEWCGMGETAIVQPQGKQRPSAEKKPDAPQDNGSSRVREAPAVSNPAANETPRQGADEQGTQDNQPLAFQLKLDTEHPYLASRGVGTELAGVFEIGYCSKGMFRGMIAIALRNSDGRLVGYLGRWPGEPPEGQEQRYKFPIGFKKSRMLYNLDRVRGREELVIVEGVWSVLRLHQLGVPAVALLGRDLSAYQEQLLVQSRVKRLALMLDGNAPGREATALLLPRLSRRFYVRVLALPDEAQPDTLPEEELRALLNVLSLMP